MSKRSGFDLKELTDKRAKLENATGAASATARNNKHSNTNPYLSSPVPPEKTLQIFLQQCRTAARRYLPQEEQQTASKPNAPITTPFCEVEVRLGILHVPHVLPERRVTSSGAKHVNGFLAQAFDCGRHEPRCLMEPGVSRSHFLKWTGSGLSEISPLSQALGVSGSTDAAAAASHLKRDLVETEMVETVYAGYAQSQRVCFPGDHPPSSSSSATPDHPVVGKMEIKKKLSILDLTVPAAPYDIRVTLSSEKVTDRNIQNQPPPGWKIKRIKRRRSYSRRDKSIAWQIDVTEVTTTHANAKAQPAHVDYEIEIELRESVLLQLINEDDQNKLREMTAALAKQLWWILTQINPLADALDVEETMRDHPNKQAVQLALAQCGALKRFMDSGANGGAFDSPIGKNTPPPASLANINFPGCMPVNFSRHNLEEIQRSPDSAYFLSEKTDGVRHFLIFTGDTAVLVDRAMRGKQPLPVGGTDDKSDPFAPILGLIQPGTVLDGEVVMNRRGAKPRPIFIVFDVMAISASTAVLHLPFEDRLKHLKQATFRTPTANRNMFDPADVANPQVALPLVRKNFVKRTDVDKLLSYVVCLYPDLILFSFVLSASASPVCVTL